MNPKLHRSVNMPLRITYAILYMIASVLFVALITSCATDTGNAAKDARARATNQALIEAGKVLGKIAVNTLLNAAQQEMTGGKVDFGSAASAELWRSAGTIVDSNAVEHIITAYSGNNLPMTAGVAATAFASSSYSSTAKANAIASVISTAAGAPPK